MLSRPRREPLRRPAAAADRLRLRPLINPTKRSMLLPLALTLTFCLAFVYLVHDHLPYRSCTQHHFPHAAVDVVAMDMAAAAGARPTHWQALSTLVLVAGHAVYVAKRWDPAALLDERNWLLERFQTGQVPTFLRHVEKGVQLAANDSNALLLFSGGQTRQGAGPRSEGVSYWLAADSERWFGQPHVRNRTLAEEYARDSLENLLFSICRFRQVVGRYPTVIKVVGFNFKRVRFVQLHRRALRFPAHNFEYHGIDPPDTDAMHSVSAGERARALGPFQGDPYGCKTRILHDKKMVRNPYLRYHPYPQGCPEITGLFTHCERSIFQGPLPWDAADGGASQHRTNADDSSQNTLAKRR